MLINKEGEHEEKLKDKADFLQNLGTTNHQLKKFDDALSNFHESIKFKKEISDKSGIAWTYGSIALLYVMQDDFQRAFEIRLQALEIYEQLEDTQNIIFTRGKLSELYKLKGDLQKFRVLSQ